MAFEKTVPQWDAAGTEPPSSLKSSGFTAGYKPPAAYFNWFWHGVSQALTELQDGAQPMHYFYEPTDIGCTTASTPSEIWNAMPDHSVFVYPAPNLTDASWNFPNALGTVHMEKYAAHRAVIQLFGKTTAIGDYRMFLDEETGDPSGVWSKVYTSDNKLTPWLAVYADTFEVFWNEIYGVASDVGMAAFRLKDTGGFGPLKTANTWYNGITFWQNPPTSEDNINGTVLLRMNSPTNWVLYKGIVSGNATNGYTVNWMSVYDTNNKPTLSDLAYFGINPISATADDTVANWKAKGSGFASFNAEGCLNGQPAKYGMMIQYVVNADVIQLWMTTVNGPLYYRNGNANGWWADSSGAKNSEWKNLSDADTVDGIHVQTDPGSAGIKPIYATTSDLTAGTSALATGTICLVYE